MTDNKTNNDNNSNNNEIKTTTTQKRKREDLEENSNDNENNKIINPIKYLGRTPPTNPIFEIVYKSKDYCLVNKPYDVNIDDDGKGRNDTLLKYIELKYPELKGEIRFVNRIDYATSGIVVTALNKKSANKGMELFQNRDSVKQYLAIVHGHLVNDEGLIDKPIADDKSDQNSFKMCIGSIESNNPGRSSQTVYKVLERGYINRSKQFYDKLINLNNNSNNSNNTINSNNNEENIPNKDISNNNNNNNNDNNINNNNNTNINNNDKDIIRIPVTKVLLLPKTGRRHQLRVHLLSIGHVIVGDETYSPKDPESNRMFLHSWKLNLPFKSNIHEQINIETPDPFINEIILNK